MKRLAAALLALTGVAPAAQAIEASPAVRAVTRGSGYATGAKANGSELIVPLLVVPHGGSVLFTNLHVWGHSITSDAWAMPGEERLFRSEVIPFGDTVEVQGVPTLEPGEYGFFCSNHRGMRGTLRVLPAT